MNYAGRVNTQAKTVDARGCTALTELKADAAEYVDASGCTALTELKADAAKTVYASGCTALTELKVSKNAKVYRGPIRWFWHIHHESLVEMEAEPIEERREYIRTSKPSHEIETRLRLLREVGNQEMASKLVAAGDTKGLERLHAKECPNCPWNGRTIFP